MTDIYKVPAGVTVVPPPNLSDAGSITRYAKQNLDGDFVSKPGHDTQDSYNKVVKTPTEANAQAFVSNLSQAAATANDGLSPDEIAEVRAAATAALQGAGLSAEVIAQAVSAGFDATPIKEDDSSGF